MDIFLLYSCYNYNREVFMATKEELRKLLEKEELYDILEKHHIIGELLSILEIMLEDDAYYNVDDVFRWFPESSQYDKYKTNVIDEIALKKDEYFLFYDFITFIFDDNTKLEYLEKYRSTFENYQIADIINSLRSDELRKEVFRENIHVYNDTDFSDYLRNIKSDELRMEEFLLFKDQYPHFNLSWFAGSFTTDEEKMEVFDRFYNDTTERNTDHFVSYLKKKENKLKFIEKYIDDLTPSEIGFFDFSIYSQETLVYLIRKYNNKMQSSTIEELLLKIKSDEKRISLLDEVSNSLSSSSVMRIITKINNNDKRIEVFDKYKDLFKYSDLRTMLVELDETHSIKFLDKYIDYYDGEILAEIWVFPNFFRNIAIPRDEFLNKYIGHITAKGFSLMMEKLLEEYHNYESVIQYLLKKVKNKVTIRRILNGIAFTDKDYFIKNLLNNNAFTQEERDLCDKLSGGNTNFYSYFLFELFEIPSLKKNRYFLSKLSKFPDISQNIVNLYYKKPNIISLLLLFIKKLYSYDIYHDNLINRLINVLNSRKSSYLNDIVMGELTEDRKLILIYRLINNQNDNLIIDVDIDNNLDSYLERRNNKIDELYQSSNDLKEKKNLLFNKIFGFSITMAENILSTYGFSIDKLEKEIGYVRIIKTIIEEKNIDKINEYYNSLEVLSLEERLLFEDNLKKQFTKRIRDSLYKIRDNKPRRNLLYKGQEVPVYEPSKDFYLMVNSFSAYRSHDYIGDYNAFWNNNENVKNHGICCSLISNQNIYQTAPIYDVIVGFDDFADTSIQLADSTDIASSNDEFDLYAYHKSRFMIPQDYIDETRHSHNELVLERRELRKNKRNINIKPSYVIIYDFFDAEKYDKSLKAARELNIPVVYINTADIIARENLIVNEYLDEAMNGLNIELFNKFIVRYCNNAYGLNRYVSTIFNQEGIEEKLDDMFSSIDSAYSNKEINKKKAIKLLEDIIKILNIEKSKCGHIRQVIIDVDPLIDSVKKNLDRYYNKKDYKEK